MADPVREGINCTFKGDRLTLTHRMKRKRRPYSHRIGLSNRQLDTMSNWYSPKSRYVEIIRQDDPWEPTIGMALGFEFNDSVSSFPYHPEYARLQIKNFKWGGVEFSQRDSSNYTGVSNAVSDDITVAIDGFSADTIYGRFSGLLLSGAGPMAPLDSGYFRVLLYRRE